MLSFTLIWISVSSFTLIWISVSNIYAWLCVRDDLRQPLRVWFLPFMTEQPAFTVCCEALYRSVDGIMQWLIANCSSVSCSWKLWNTEQGTRRGGLRDCWFIITEVHCSWAVIACLIIGLTVVCPPPSPLPPPSFLIYHNIRTFLYGSWVLIKPIKGWD